MKTLLVLLLAAAPAMAQSPSTPLCIRASDRNDYNARPISRHDVLAKNALGADHRAARIATTCIHVDRTATVALQSMTRCLALGDSVSTVTIDGRREQCRVTRVEAVTDDYGAAKYRD